MPSKTGRRLDTVTPRTFAVAALIMAIAVVLMVGVRRQGSSDQAIDDQGSDENQTAAPATTTSSATSTQSKPPEPFRVIGSTIVNPKGEMFVPVGANVAISAVDYPFVFEGGNGGVNGRVDAIRDWDWNTVRATLRCGDTEGGPSQSEIIEGIAETVDELTKAEIVVIISCHDATGQNPAVGSELELSVRSFWDRVVPLYGDNPFVWFNFFNEPFTDNDLSAWAELHRFYLDRYRAKDSTNIVIVDLPVYGQAIDQAISPEVADTVNGSCNTVVGWHSWGAFQGSQGTVEDFAGAARAATDAGLAVLIEEAGVPEPADAGTAGSPEWNASGFDAALTVADDLDLGLLWWHGTGDTSAELFYPLTADRTGFWTASQGQNLTEAGKRFWDFSHRTPPSGHRSSSEAGGC